MGYISKLILETAQIAGQILKGCMCRLAVSVCLHGSIERAAHAQVKTSLQF